MEAACAGRAHSPLCAQEAFDSCGAFPGGAPGVISLISLGLCSAEDIASEGWEVTRLTVPVQPLLPLQILPPEPVPKSLMCCDSLKATGQDLC